MSPYLQAWALLEKNGIEPAGLIDRACQKGYFYVWPDGIIIGELAEGDPGELIVWLAIGKNCLQRFCQLAPPGVSRVSFARGLRGKWDFKIYSLDRIKRLCTTTATHTNLASPALR